MPSSSAIIKLLQQLLKRSYRQDKLFDKYQLNFLKKLQSSVSDDVETQLINECSDKLINIPDNMEDTLSEGRLIVSQSQLQLQRMEVLSSKVKDKIHDMQVADQPYTINDHHSELVALIKIYQRTIIELNQTSPVTTTDSKSDIEAINNELHQLLLEIDVGENYVQKIEKIRLTILNEADPITLPYHCLSIINIIIDSTREERRSSRHFLYTLNDSLSEFYLNFSHTAKLAKTEFKQQDENLTNIQQQAEQLREYSQSTQDLASLREHIDKYVNEMQATNKEKEQQQKEAFRQQFQGMVRQIKELQSETKSYQSTLKQQNKLLHIDFLTKIPNRAAWSERLEMEVSRFERYKNPLIMAIIDVDTFKNINDTYGHLAGDKVLNVIAQTLKKSIRKTDFIARFGGEEFAILLPETPKSQALQVLNKLCQHIEAIPFKFKKESVTVTISIGFTQFTNNDESDAVFNRADSALYQAKNNGKNQVCFVDHLIK